MSPKIQRWKDKTLFTPGPLTTSCSIKQAMLRDLGSRDFEFIEIIKNIRQELLNIGNVANANYESILLQGSGTYGIEAVLNSTTPPEGKWLIISNGAYGKRMAQIAEANNLMIQLLEYPEDSLPIPAEIDQILQDDPQITHIGMVHCETSTGMFNPINEIGEIISKHNKKFFVDAMSSFGAVPINLKESNIDYLVSSANKCIEGVPGFCFILARRSSLVATRGYSRTVSLNLFEQWRGLEETGQFRFTPPTHALLAFNQALQELKEEGGVSGRRKRYLTNYYLLIKEMEKLGFETFLPVEKRGYIITSFKYPQNSNFNFNIFYQLLNDRDITIYPGKVSQADCFRIGNIGRLFPADIKALLGAVQDVLIEMNIQLKEVITATLV